jgi:hypothetical protein
VQYIAQHLSSMLLLPEVRQALTKLPAVLLMQLLSSEALEVDQVGARLQLRVSQCCCPKVVATLHSTAMPCSVCMHEIPA